jgi:hypothetical protein
MFTHILINLSSIFISPFLLVLHNLSIEVTLLNYLRINEFRYIMGWCSTGWTIGTLGFDSRRRLGIFLFTTASRTALGPTQPPIQWVPGTLSLRVKRQGREADHTPPSSAEVKNEWSYTSTSPIRLHGVVLRKKYILDSNIIVYTCASFTHPSLLYPRNFHPVL